MKYTIQKKQRKQNHKKPQTRKMHRRGGTKKIPFSKMNCSPLVENKRATDETCYTPDILQKIRDSYNQSHPESKIETDDMNQIWHQLKSKLSTCTKEDCWLKEIKHTKMQQDLDEYIFAPDRPPEWTQNPNEWLSNIDILKVLRQYEKTHSDFKFIGPTPIDFDSRPTEEGGKCVWEELCHLDLGKLLKRGIHKIGIIFNLDKHDQSGSHWVSLFVSMDPTRQDKYDNFAFFFDSAGVSAPKEVKELVSRIQTQWISLSDEHNKHPIRYIENAPHAHQYSNTECGMYSLIFIITMLSGKQVHSEKGGSQSKQMSMKERIQLFQTGKITDKQAEMYRNILFNAPN